MKQVLILLLFAIFAITVKADNKRDLYLIQEMESLIKSLPVEDSSRIDLTLRLADLYFDISIREGNSESNVSNLKIQRENFPNFQKKYQH